MQRRNKEMLTGTPLPATTQANSSMGGDLLQHSNTQTIPNPTIKEAENLAKERKNIEAKYNIKPIKEFGTNYAEFYHDGANAIKKLLTEKQGQVAGAFERKELGDIDLVWGEAKTANGDIKGYGLSKIEAKHLNDFASFYGDTPQEKLINGISEIISNGKIKIDKNGRATITYETKDNKIYKVGLKQNWKGEPTTNKWIITAYDDIREANKIINSNGFTKGETLPLNSNTGIIPPKTKTTIKPQDEVVKTEVIKKENGNKGQLAQQNIKQKEAKPNLEEPNVLTKLMKTVEEIYTDDGDFKVKTLKVYGSEKNKDFSVYIDNKKVSIPEEQTTKFHDNGERFAFVRDGEIVDNLSQEAKEALFDNNKISGMDKIQMGIALDKAKVSTLSDKIDALKKAGYSDDNIYEYLLKKDSELIDGIASIKANTKFNSILDSVKGSSSQIQKLRAILDKNIMNTDTLSNIKKPQLLNEVYNLLNGKRLNNELLDKASLIKWNFKGFEHKNALKHNDFFTFTHNMLNLIKSTEGDANQKSTLRKIITAKIKDLDSDEAKNSVIKKISYELYDKELSPELLQKVAKTKYPQN
ncbi:putative barnase/colicin E5 family endoribonuclease [Campylobacter hyointestinalis]|uniref:putative barnase/colicin E5 family endoribonuclease n=1 Tax=Campylobacter hyointestinalis TaxID=198 RepID=UPI002157784F|nr:DUF3519 domain-containing protein [Campylobacter hyointestinalis]